MLNLSTVAIMVQSWFVSYNSLTRLPLNESLSSLIRDYLCSSAYCLSRMD